MTCYIALLHKDEGTDYGVCFPDFPGCTSAGSDMEEALEHAEEALALHTTAMIEEGYEIPEPSSLQVVMSDLENRDGVAALVRLPSQIDPLVRIGISIPVEEVRHIDDYAESHGLRRSEVLAMAVRKTVGIE
ncbi:type II toxin-antitoxin system HicB family antitoxin [Fulvimarina sp. MAC8]|uniref:type II toxin-antitoxin system HicB family antitoxin n=1 Tax=Fulvimarina sp. MAC8 TaxID=3162874 RepID=UPI0032F03698